MRWCLVFAVLLALVGMSSGAVAQDDDAAEWDPQTYCPASPTASGCLGPATPCFSALGTSCERFAPPTGVMDPDSLVAEAEQVIGDGGEDAAAGDNQRVWRCKRVPQDTWCGLQVRHHYTYHYTAQDDPCCVQNMDVCEKLVYEQTGTNYGNYLCAESSVWQDYSGQALTYPWSKNSKANRSCANCPSTMNLHNNSVY